MVEASRLEGRPSLILGPLLPFLSALQVPETSFLALSTFRTHLISVLSLKAGAAGCFVSIGGHCGLTFPCGAGSSG